MKYLLFILLFFTCKLQGQITLTFSANAQTATPGAVVTINSGTYVAGRTYIFLIGTYRTGADPSDNPTVSSGALTLVKLGTFVGSHNIRWIAYSSVVGGSDQTTAITFTYAESQDTKISITYYHTSANVNYDVAGASNTTADPSITLPARQNASTIASFTNNTDPFGGTAESGWTEDFDAGSAVPVGSYSMHRNSTTDNTPTVTAGASNWSGIAVQIYGRRRIIID